MELLIILLILLLVFGASGWYTGRSSWGGADVAGILWTLFFIVLIVWLLRALGVV